jgi:hypothetical protein
MKSTTLAVGISILKNAEGNRLTQEQFIEAASAEGLERNRANGSIGAMVTQKLAVNPVETVDGNDNEQDGDGDEDEDNVHGADPVVKGG